MDSPRSDAMSDAVTMLAAQNGNGATDEQPLVTIFIRKSKDADDALTLTFKIPAGLEPRDLLVAGFAVNGNEAAVDFARFDGTGPWIGQIAGGGHRLRNVALVVEEKAIVQWLADHGVKATFA
jgi:hypothetical protein